MTDSRLSRQQVLALYKKLATDDGYRARFEAKPAAAMLEIGVPADVIVNLAADHLVPVKLADKARFEEAWKQLVNEADEECLCMIAPQLRLDGGEEKAGR